jgi:hypothetical protein
VWGVWTGLWIGEQVYVNRMVGRQVDGQQDGCIMNLSSSRTSSVLRWAIKLLSNYLLLTCEYTIPAWTIASLSCGPHPPIRPQQVPAEKMATSEPTLHSDSTPSSERSG